MSTQNENPLVKLIKKSVGLPTGESACCGTSASSACCGAEGAQDSSAGCGCGSEGGGGDCCGAEEEKESATSPAIGSSAI